MVTIAQAANEFLSCRRIAVTGVSRTPGSHGSNVVYDRLVERGYEAFAVNPNATEIAGQPAYPSLSAIPDGVDAVVIGTAPGRALDTMKEAVELGIGQVWLHRSIDAGSVSADAVAYGREHGVRVIDGGCPLMFDPASDGGHKVMCRLLTWFGKVPRQVA
ncbi:MAG: CoA-binding protein [Actinobacteria bacterium]|nr:CoA-binding protein [Actinomycetota bacterium]